MALYPYLTKPALFKAEFHKKPIRDQERKTRDHKSLISHPNLGSSFRVKHENYDFGQKGVNYLDDEEEMMEEEKLSDYLKDNSNNAASHFCLES